MISWSRFSKDGLIDQPVQPVRAQFFSRSESTSGCKAGSGALAYKADSFYVLVVHLFVEPDFVSFVELQLVEGILEPVKLGRVRSSWYWHILVD